MPKSESKHQVYTLLVQVGRSQDDGMPEDASGAAMVCYSTGIDEAEAVRECVALLKRAGLSPLDVTGYGSLAERLGEGHDIPEEERDLMQRALDENSVVVAQTTTLYDEDMGDPAPEGGGRSGSGNSKPGPSKPAGSKADAKGVAKGGAKGGRKPR